MRASVSTKYREQFPFRSPAVHFNFYSIRSDWFEEVHAPYVGRQRVNEITDEKNLSKEVSGAQQNKYENSIRMAARWGWIYWKESSKRSSCDEFLFSSVISMCVYVCLGVHVCIQNCFYFSFHRDWCVRRRRVCWFDVAVAPTHRTSEAARQR